VQQVGWRAEAERADSEVESLVTEQLTGYELASVQQIIAILEGLPADAETVYLDTVGYSERALAAVAAFNAQGGGGSTARTVRIVLIADGTAVASGEDFASYDFIVGSDLNGLSLTSISWFVKTASSSGLPSFAVRKNAATEMLSTNCTIDANELTSDTAATPPVINPSNKGVVTGDVLHFDCDAAGTGTKGSEVRMTFA
jgi:hypothetical protein